MGANQLGSRSRDYTKIPSQGGEICGNVLMDNGSDVFEMTYFNNDSQSVSSPTGMCTRFETDHKQIVRTPSVASPNPNTLGRSSISNPFTELLSTNRL